jgi:hypothetical protein
LRRIAFDLDETLGVPMTDGRGVVAWQMRPGCADLLDRLRPKFEVVLWSVSPRRYVDQALAAGLDRWSAESHLWDEVPARRKDVWRLRADWLVDDSPHHAQAAAEFGLASRYIVVPAYGSPEDAADPLAWVRLVEAAVAQDAEPGAAPDPAGTKAFPESSLPAPAGPLSFGVGRSGRLARLCRSGERLCEPSSSGLESGDCRRPSPSVGSGSR